MAGRRWLMAAGVAGCLVVVMGSEGVGRADPLVCQDALSAPSKPAAQEADAERDEFVQRLLAAATVAKCEGALSKVVLLRGAGGADSCEYHFVRVDAGEVAGLYQAILEDFKRGEFTPITLKRMSRLQMLLKALELQGRIKLPAAEEKVVADKDGFSGRDAQVRRLIEELFTRLGLEDWKQRSAEEVKEAGASGGQSVMAAAAAPAPPPPPPPPRIPPMGGGTVMDLPKLSLGMEAQLAIGIKELIHKQNEEERKAREKAMGKP
jgi:hypothetical protein